MACASVDGAHAVGYVRAPEICVRENNFDGAATFSATMMKDREHLGERVTAWLDEHPDRRVVDTVVTQSSDAAFHCITFTLFWREPQ